jgi:predicted Zn-dependent protease
MKRSITILAFVFLVTISTQTDLPQVLAKYAPPVASPVSKGNAFLDHFLKADEAIGINDRGFSNHHYTGTDDHVYKKEYGQFRNEISHNHVHWNSDNYPLKVYIQQTDSRSFKSVYKQYVDYAFRVWENADTRIKFKYVTSVSDADISFSFVDNLMEKYERNYLGLTNYDLAGNSHLKFSYIQIGMRSEDGEKLTDGVVKATIIHELGHAIGLDHSSNKRDIMYPFINPDSSPKMDFTDLSMGDINSVRSIVNLGFKNLLSRR